MRLLAVVTLLLSLTGNETPAQAAGMDLGGYDRALIFREYLTVDNALACERREDLADVFKLSLLVGIEIRDRLIAEGKCVLTGKARIRLRAIVGWTMTHAATHSCELEVDLVRLLQRRPDPRFRYILWGTLAPSLLDACRRRDTA